MRGSIHLQRLTAQLHSTVMIRGARTPNRTPSSASHLLGGSSATWTLDMGFLQLSLMRVPYSLPLLVDVGLGEQNSQMVAVKWIWISTAKPQ